LLFKSICSNFDKVIKLFTSFCLQSPTKKRPLPVLGKIAQYHHITKKKNLKLSYVDQNITFLYQCSNMYYLMLMCWNVLLKHNMWMILKLQSNKTSFLCKSNDLVVLRKYINTCESRNVCGLGTNTSHHVVVCNWQISMATLESIWKKIICKNYKRLKHFFFNMRKWCICQTMFINISRIKC